MECALITEPQPVAQWIENELADPVRVIRLVAPVGEQKVPRIYLAVRVADPEGSGMYRLTIDGKWEHVAKYDGLTVNLSGWEGFPSMTSDGRLAMMSDTSVVQIYRARWPGQGGVQ